MTDKEAIDNLKNYIECLMEDYGYYKDIVEFRDSVEHLEKSLKTQQAEIEKKDKIIDLMAEEFEDLKLAYFKKEDGGEFMGKYRTYNKNDWEQYFENKVKESK